MPWQGLRRLLGSRAPDPTRTVSAPPLRPGSQQARGVIFDPTSARLAIVGESFRQETLRALGGAYTARGVERTPHQAALRPEPDNPSDAAAIAVYVEGRHVGYLGRTDARAYRPVIDLLARLGLGVGCHASLTGGWDRGSGEQANIGVVLHLGSPGELVEELREGGLLTSADDAGLFPHAVEEMPPPIAAPAARPEDLVDLPGKSVCFTGESVCTVGGLALSRPTQEILATNAGLRVLPRVSKKLDLLVVSPVVGRTRKVIRAAELGIGWVDEPTFWRAVGVKID